MVRSKTIITTLLFALFSTIPIYSSDNELNILMVLWRGITDAERGFQAKLDELGYTPNYSIIDPKQNRGRLVSSLRDGLKPQLSRYDYIYSFGTTASSVTHIIVDGEVPHIFNIVTDPVKAGIAKSMDSAGVNISGVSHYIPIELQINTALKILNFKSLGFIYNPREKNSTIILIELHEIAESKKLNFYHYRIAPVGDLIETQIQKIRNQSKVLDVIYLPLDSYVVSNASEICYTLKDIGIPTIGAQKEYIDAGALMGLVPNYYKLGEEAALILDRCEKGEKLENIPVVTEDNPKILVNRKTKDYFNIAIPEDLLDQVVYIEN